MRNHHFRSNKHYHEKVDPCVVILIADDGNDATKSAGSIPLSNKNSEPGTVVVVQRESAFWFSPATWRGRFILGLGLWVVMLVQIDYQLGYWTFWFAFLPSAVGVVIPWKTLFVICQRFTFHCRSRIRKFQATYENDLEEQDTALFLQRMARQEAVFGGQRAVRTKPLTGCRALGWRGIVLLGLALAVCHMFLVRWGERVAEQYPLAVVHVGFEPTQRSKTQDVSC